MTSGEWVAAEHARDVLAAELLDRPEVVMVDIGRDEALDHLILRVHVRTEREAIASVPKEVEGIPVRVVPGDYRLEGSP
jgi:hypothetical protein